jgi:hypothetical protein
MRRISFVAAILVLTLVGSAPAQEVAPTQFFPIVAHTAGAGQPPTQWATDLVINNLSAHTVAVGLQFFPAGQPNAIDPNFPIRINLSVRETVLFEDVLSTYFGYDQNITGMLLVTCDPDFMLASGNLHSDRILATTRTYNVGSPEGTFGQTVPSLRPMANAYSSQSFVTGARNDSRFRSNLGIANLSLQTATIHFRIMRGRAQILSQGTRTLDAMTVGQWSFQQLGVGQNDGAMTVDLWLDPDDVMPNPCLSPWPNMFMAYVSKVDGNPEGTGDAEFLYATPVEILDCD